VILALVATRILAPYTKLTTTRRWRTTTLAGDFGVAEADEQDCYAALGWLLKRQGRMVETLHGKIQLLLCDGAQIEVFGQYCRINPWVFSFVPLSQGQVGIREALRLTFADCISLSVYIPCSVSANAGVYCRNSAWLGRSRMAGDRWRQAATQNATQPAACRPRGWTRMDQRRFRSRMVRPR